MSRTQRLTFLAIAAATAVVAVIILVVAGGSDEVHVHGYDLMKDIEPGRLITFSFPADITGMFEIELESAGQQIAQLRVDPR